jgi:hypothetical protein
LKELTGHAKLFANGGKRSPFSRQLRELVEMMAGAAEADALARPEQLFSAPHQPERRGVQMKGRRACDALPLREANRKRLDELRPAPTRPQQAALLATAHG